MIKRFIVPAISCALFCSGLPTASAKPPPDPPTNRSEADVARARELFENGRRLYLDGAYEAAIVAFREAYSLSGDHILLYNVAQCYDRMDRFDEALEYLEYYRPYARESERDALTEKVQSLRRRKIKAKSENPSGTQQPSAEISSSEQEPETTQRGPSGQDDRAKDKKIYGPLAISLTAVSGAAFVTAIGLAAASTVRRNAAECGSNPTVCSEDSKSDLSASENLALGADIGFAIGAAAAIGLITVIALRISKKKRQSRAHHENVERRVQLMPGTAIGVRF